MTKRLAAVPENKKFIVLAGSGGGTANLAMFCSTPRDLQNFETITYPCWRRYVEMGYTADKLVDDLIHEINARVPEGPIRLIGVSLGGHFAYAIALRLRAEGREIGGLCAVDSYIAQLSATPSTGWITRATKLAMRLVRDGRFSEFGKFVRSRLWRSVLRTRGNTLPETLRRYAAAGEQPPMLKRDPLLETELDMRLLVEISIPLLTTLDHTPQPIDAPTLLLRTKKKRWRRSSLGVSAARISTSSNYQAITIHFSSPRQWLSAAKHSHARASHGDKVIAA